MRMAATLALVLSLCTYAIWTDGFAGEMWLGYFVGVAVGLLAPCAKDDGVE